MQVKIKQNCYLNIAVYFDIIKNLKIARQILKSIKLKKKTKIEKY